MQSSRKLPGQVGGVADPGVHAEAAGRNDQMSRVSREEDAVVAVSFGTQQMLGPLVDREHLEGNIHRDGAPENDCHLSICGGGRVQAPMAGAVLQNEKGEQRSVRDMVVPTERWRNLVPRITGPRTGLDLSFLPVVGSRRTLPAACSAFARAMPALTRATIIARSNSLNTPSIRNIALPAGVVVSIACWCNTRSTRAL